MQLRKEKNKFIDKLYCHTSASSTASMMRAPSKDRFSIKIF